MLIEPDDSNARQAQGRNQTLPEARDQVRALHTMTEPTIHIRIKSGMNEIEINAPITHIQASIDYLPALYEKIPAPRPTIIHKHNKQGIKDILMQMFNSQWGMQQRDLHTIRKTLDTYGYYYPKTSVAVTLGRLVDDGRLRRFQNNYGEYEYILAESAPTVEITTT